ncbi:response regulator [Myxococcus stipitatus DSM 14675]|uniref:Response regulator n=1 Tax=Myxococcus stipitatus (strain DSM 14675 / JCM 12634 / Mx s8) TaxID=1278073 RepID=L7UGI3_MYXSD|nr:response regulator [Myxococcus stipitatus]AGC46960.1 response regulator [Myxococcus stipitatus DSM 14675]
MGAERIKVLLVEDDGDSRELLAELLEFEFDVVTATDGLAGLRAFESARPDVVVTDESLPGLCGTELAQRVKAHSPRTKVILVSGYSEVSGAGHCDLVLRKPIDVEQLSRAVGRLGDEARQWAGDDARQ